MGRLAHIAARLASASALTAILSGCGYRELKAPCGPDEGSALAMSYATAPATPMTGSPLDRLGVGVIPVTDPCGPLRSIKSGRSISGAPP